MALQIVGEIELNAPLLDQDLGVLKTMDFSDAYSDYALGFWKTIVLANQSGDDKDALSTEYTGSAKLTRIGRQLPYITTVVKQTFHWDFIKSVRIFSSGQHGMIIPHIDYLEFKKGFSRFHLPLQTHPESYNSEEDRVYHMKKGEIWFLDAQKIHSAGTFGEIPKLSLVIDFAPDIPFVELFSNADRYKPRPSPEIDHREPLSSDYINNLLDLYKVIDERNFNDVLALLAKVHFFKRVSSECVYDWLDEICDRTSVENLKKKSAETRMRFLGKIKNNAANS